MAGAIFGLLCLAFVAAYLTLKFKAGAAGRRGDRDREHDLAAAAFKLRMVWIGAGTFALFVVVIVAVATH